MAAKKSGITQNHFQLILGSNEVVCGSDQVISEAISKSKLTLLQMAEDKFIDIREVIKSKNPRILKWMPPFALGYIRRILHENDINGFMSRNGARTGIPFIEKVFEEFEVEIAVVGEENIPNSGGVIFAANHPLGGPDAMALMLAVSRYRNDIKFLVNDVLTNLKNLAPLFVPINKHGGQGREAVERVEAAYDSDQALMIFPAGLVSRKQKQGIRDLEWKKSFVSKAKRYEKPVVPVFISGRNSNFFYNLANFRKALGLKANIEMFYLADEMYKQAGGRITIYIGKPIPHTAFDGSKTDAQWAESVKDKVYALSSKNETK